MAITKIDDRQVVNRAALSAIGSAANASLDSVFSDINTLFSNATSNPTPSVLMERDANANTRVNNLIDNFSTTLTATSTTTLTVASAYLQQFTGTSDQTVVLPNATTGLVVGQSFSILNRTTGTVTVNKNGGTLVQSMSSGSQAIVTVTDISTSAGVWDVSYLLNSISLKVPTITQLTSTGTTTGYLFTITTSSTVSVGDTYLNNGNTYTVLGSLSAQSGKVLFMSNASAPTASGNLTRITGSGTPTISFTSNVPLATYTVPTPAPLYLEIEGVGAGGGGGGDSNGGTNGSSGSSTFFGANIIIATPGSGGQSAGSAGAGGTGTINSPAYGIIIHGAGGQAGNLGNASTGWGGGIGGGNPLAGAQGSVGAEGAGRDGVINTGGGGGGGGGLVTFASGSGGGAGGYIKAILPNPVAGTAYPYAIGIGGALGTGGHANGGTGADGVLHIWEKYQ